MDLCLTLLLICLCSQGATEGESSTSEPLASTDVATKELAAILTSNKTSLDVNETGDCQSASQSPKSQQAIAAAVQNLGVQLLQNLETTPEHPNIIISPLSISLALSQLALGAKNETEELLMHHLHENAVPCYHRSLRDVLAQLKKRDLQIATRIFLRQGYFLRNHKFVSESQLFYGSEPAVLESLQQINEWVENATNGRMTDFLFTLPPNLLLMLINAVHFKGEWKARFDPNFTSRGVFYLDDLHMVDVDVMEDAKHQLSCFADNELEAQVARFPFTKLMSLLVVMPESGQVNVSALCAKLNISDLYERLPKETAVQVKVPKFKLEYSQELQEVLTKLGLGEMFLNPNLADIADGPLLVSSVMHKSSMEINEDGAEAAAATNIVISRAAIPVFHLTKPFFFVLMDDVTQIPIFMGVINNPNPGAPILQKGQFGSKDKMGFSYDKDHMSSFGGPK
uniref:Serpin domain-containing protein n=1 Tax=Nothobranchius furzeri TaxID=105023 RepID=A0A8C6KJM1_NOTFU